MQILLRLIRAILTSLQWSRKMFWSQQIRTKSSFNHSCKKLSQSNLLKLNLLKPNPRSSKLLKLWRNKARRRSQPVVVRVVRCQVLKFLAVQKRLSYLNLLNRKKAAQVVFFLRTSMLGSSSCFKSRSKSWTMCWRKMRCWNSVALICRLAWISTSSC